MQWDTQLSRFHESTWYWKILLFCKFCPAQETRILIYPLHKIWKVRTSETPDHKALSFNICSSNLISLSRLLRLHFIIHLMLNCWVWLCPNGINPVFIGLAEVVAIWLLTRMKGKLQCGLKETDWSLWWQGNLFWFMSHNPENLAAYPLAGPQDIMMKTHYGNP